MKISVCMATYNGEKFLFRQLESILKQLNAEDEIIISDDSSSDKTLEIIWSFQDERIRLYPGQTFRSPISNFENALSFATGDIIILADQDDVWMETKVSTILRAITDADIVLSDCRIIDENDRVIEESYFRINGSKEGFFKNLFKNSYLGCCMAFRKSVLGKALPFPKDIPMHDWWIGLIGEIFYKIRVISEPLVLYRKHSANASPTSSGKSNFSYYRRLQFRWALVKELFKLCLIR